MLDKNKMLELYIRHDYSFAEKLYENYLKMREATSNYESIKYSPEETSQNNLRKEGFIAGIHIMLSLIADL